MVYVGVVGVLPMYVDVSLPVDNLLGVTSDPSILSILGARVMLNLKVEGERSLEQGTSRPTKSTMLGIEFVVPPLDDEDIELDESQIGTEMSEATKFEEIVLGT